MLAENLGQSGFISLGGLTALIILTVLIGKQYRSYTRLRHVPGRLLYALTDYRLALDAWNACSIHTVRRFHRQYGPVVRIGPNTVSFNSLSALRTIYGAGSGFERTSFYRMFDAYGRPNLFTFASGQAHRERKKLVSHIYSNQTILGPETSDLILHKVSGFLKMLEEEPGRASEIFRSLHYFSFDAISDFVYGPHGRTNALAQSSPDRDLIDDILSVDRRRMAWFAIHFPAYTKWITSRTGWLGSTVETLGLLPMKRPFTYSGIRAHALRAFHHCKAASSDVESRVEDNMTVIGRLFQAREKHGLSDMDIASECADHLLAGIDTTADSLMFLIWALSLPQNTACQEKLREEIETTPVDAQNLPEPRNLFRLPYLNAVLRESLRLYTPLPAFEPRTSPSETEIDGFKIHPGTIVGVSPYCLHRDEVVFPEPLEFRPERWLASDGTLVPESDPRNRWFWAFSSGARMCIGMHLANAEMLTLVTAIYQRYRTTAKSPDTSPGITSRYEIFCDETFEKMEEHECQIEFQDLDST